MDLKLEMVRGRIGYAVAASTQRSCKQPFQERLSRADFHSACKSFFKIEFVSQDITVYGRLQLRAGTFEYARHFPYSKAQRFAMRPRLLFSEFAKKWLGDRCPFLEDGTLNIRGV